MTVLIFGDTITKTIIDRLRFLSKYDPDESFNLKEVPDDNKPIYMYPSTHNCVTEFEDGYCVGVAQFTVIKSTIWEHHSRIKVIYTGDSTAIVHVVLREYEKLLSSNKNMINMTKPYMTGLRDNVLKDCALFRNNYFSTLNKSSEQYSPELHKHELKLRLLLTNICNLHCEFCLNDFQCKPKIDSEVKFLNFDVAIKTIDAYAKLCKDNQLPIQIYLSGGEPLLHPDICDILNHVYKNIPDAKLVICTNGLLIHDLISNWLETIQHGTIHLSSLLNKIEFHISIHSYLYINPVKNVLTKMYSYIFPDLKYNINTTISFVFKHGNELHGIDECDYFVIRNKFDDLPDRIRLKYKAWMDLHRLNDEEYVNAFNELKSSYPELVYRKASPLENRGILCNNCNEHCVTLKALWVFADGTACACPKYKYKSYDLESINGELLCNIIDDARQQHLTFSKINLEK